AARSVAAGTVADAGREARDTAPQHLMEGAVSASPRRQARTIGVTCFQLTLQRGFNPALELLDLGPLLGFARADLDVGLRLQALDGGIGCGGLLVGLDLRDRRGDRWIGRGLGWLWRRRNRGGDTLGRLEEQTRRLEAQRLGHLLGSVGDV